MNSVEISFEKRITEDIKKRSIIKGKETSRKFTERANWKLVIYKKHMPPKKGPRIRKKGTALNDICFSIGCLLRTNYILSC